MEIDPHSFTPCSHSLAEMFKAPDVQFPMYTVHVDVMLAMKEIQPHESLLSQGLLTDFRPDLGKAAFVSHQWAGKQHPDPNMEQFQVLQDAVRNLLSGTIQITADVAQEAMLGLSRARDVSKEVLSDPERLFFWYDYFSCPQMDANEQALFLAVNSIPAYIARCDFFFALKPAIKAEDQQVLNHFTWADRGWCLLEGTVWTLTRKNAACIAVHSGKHCELDIWHNAKCPGSADFSFHRDRARIAPGFRRVIENKLKEYHQLGDWESYSLLLNAQSHHFRDLPIEPIHASEVSSPQPSWEGGDSLVETFLKENRFKSLKSRDASGWSVMCYAAERGDPQLMKALLELRGDPNDKTSKERFEATSSKNQSLLSICAKYNHFAAMEVLIQHNANVNVKGTTQPPLLTACGSDSVEAVELLCKHGADTRIRNKFGTSAVAAAALAGASDALETILKYQGPRPDLSGSPLFVAAMGRGSGATTLRLLEVKAHIDEQYMPGLIDPLGLLFRFKALQYRSGSSRLKTLAYHHRKATPLMVAIICGNFEMAATLIAEGAAIHLKNCRKKTALDFAHEMCAPSFIMEALAGDMTKCQSFASAASSGHKSSPGVYTLAYSDAEYDLMSTPTTDGISGEGNNYFCIDDLKLSDIHVDCFSV